MKNSRWLVTGCALALVAMIAGAQQTTMPTANPVSATVKSQLARFQKNMVGAAEAMPPEKYSFKPTQESITFAHLVLHSAQANNNLCSKISGGTAPELTLTDTDAKDKLVAALKASFDYCTTALTNADDSKLSEAVNLGPNRQSTHAGVLILVSDEWFDHYAGLAMYLRLNGILPPSAQPAK
ncbi:MAG: DinB family protein [Candidatus Acidiferrum sp.]